MTNNHLKEYRVYTTEGRGHYVRWYGSSSKQVKQEAQDSGHGVKSIRFVRQHD